MRAWKGFGRGAAGLFQPALEQATAGLRLAAEALSGTLRLGAGRLAADGLQLAPRPQAPPT